MRYFFDTEFIEKPCTIDLVSIGIVAEDGREYYAISAEFDEEQANDWVKKNVIALLEPGIERKPRSVIRDEILNFIVGGYTKPEFWSYYADYDWVSFCWIFGSMIDLPSGWPMYCRDIKQFCDSIGNPRLPRQAEGEHNALADARWHKIAFDFLLNKKISQRNIFAEIEEERLTQDKRWGGNEHDDQHLPDDWTNILDDYVYKAEYLTEDPAAFRRRLKQIAAIAVAALESVDRKARAKAIAT